MKGISFSIPAKCTLKIVREFFGAGEPQRVQESMNHTVLGLAEQGGSGGCHDTPTPSAYSAACPDPSAIQVYLTHGGHRKWGV